MENREVFMRAIDRLVAGVLEERSSWERRKDCAEEHLRECDETLKTLDILRMEILFKES